MSTPAISVIYFLITSFLGTLGQYLYKSGAETRGCLGNQLSDQTQALVGCRLLHCSHAAARCSFHTGGALTVLYPVYATTFIWAALIALAVYGTPIKPVNMVGTGLLVLGMYLMGK